MHFPCCWKSDRLQSMSNVVIVHLDPGASDVAAERLGQSKHKKEHSGDSSDDERTTPSKVPNIF